MAPFWSVLAPPEVALAAAKTHFKTAQLRLEHSGNPNSEAFSLPQVFKPFAALPRRQKAQER